jgi:predicted O-methyltransferase YrrM
MIRFPVHYKNIAFTRQELEYSEDYLVIKKHKNTSRKGTGMVMERHEEPLMQKHVDLLNVKDKDVLEIGFGMGISATMIQEAQPKSHTIIECHPQVINYFLTTYEHRDNIKLIPDYWQNVIMSIDKYDCIFFDTYADKAEQFFDIVDLKLREDGKFTYFHWENFHKEQSDYNVERHYVEYDIKYMEGGTKKGTCQVPLYTKTKTSKFNKDYKIFLP